MRVKGALLPWLKAGKGLPRLAEWLSSFSHGFFLTCLSDIQECYELSLFSASKQDGTPDQGPCTTGNQHYAGTKGTLDDQSHHKRALQVSRWASPGITLQFPYPTPNPAGNGAFAIWRSSTLHHRADCMVCFIP